jgi:hypothetical protein
VTRHEAPESAAQKPAVQVREQQLAPPLQTAPVSRHASAEQVPPMQVVPQHSALVAQA